MNPQVMTIVTGGGGLAVCAASSYLGLRRQVKWAPLVLRVAAVVAIGVNALYFGGSTRVHGIVGLFNHNFESTLMLATLVGLVGVGTHLHKTMRGLDGFLFIVAGAVQFAALAVVGYEREVVSDKPWFISHALAFTVSGACFVAGGAAGVAYLLVNRALRQKRASTMMGTVAPLEALERFGRWMLITGFPVFTYGMLTGLCGIYDNAAPEAVARRGDWFYDPFVIVSFIMWLVYAYMFGSLVLRPAMRGRRAARLAAFGMGLTGVVFLFAELISTLHK